jgi:uncharacterized protein (TIGR02597 family)
MKTKHFKILGCAALSIMCAMVSHAQSVSSTPVGYVTLTINGNGYTALSNPLENAVVYSGTASNVSGSDITTSFAMTSGEIATTDAEGNSSHYVQLADGTILDVTGNTDAVITVAADVSTLVSADDQITVKKYTTLSDLFGATNSAGLTSGADANSSDLIFIMSSDGAGTYGSYYYQDDPFDGFFGGDGWRGLGNNSTDVSDLIIAPDDGIIVKRDAATDLSVVVTGTVNAIQHNRTLPAGFSLVSYPYPVATTLDDSGIYSASNGYVSGGDANSSDIIYVLAPDGSYTSYYRQDDPFDGFFGGDGWRALGDNSTDVGSTSIPAGSAIIIKHNGSGLDWTDSTPYTL